MKEKINIAEILRDKPVNTKLYSPLFSEVFFSHVSSGGIAVEHNGGTSLFFSSGKFYDYDGAEPLLFPSKEMRDWSKFAWKKNDILVNSSGFKLFFDRWANDDYTRFFGKVNILEDSFSYETEKYTLASKGENLDTLEIEKSEFKDGDIVCISGMGYLAYGIVKSIDNSSKKLEYYVLNDMSTLKFEDWLSFEDKHIQPITETQQIILFDALEKEGKAWDAEKKQIVDLKPKFDELKPFDKVLVKHQKTEEWRANIFSHTDKTDEYLDYVCVNGRWEFCIPYIGNESLLGTTKDVEG